MRARRGARGRDVRERPVCTCSFERLPHRLPSGIVHVSERRRVEHDHQRALVTSREFVWRDLTLDWLVAHDIPYDALVMRVVGDYRADDVVKADMLDQLEADGWAITEAWEDSADIVELWESRGITVHAV